MGPHVRRRGRQRGAWGACRCEPAREAQAHALAHEVQAREAPVLQRGERSGAPSWQAAQGRAGEMRGASALRSAQLLVRWPAQLWVRRPVRLSAAPSLRERPSAPRWVRVSVAPPSVLLWCSCGARLGRRRLCDRGKVSSELCCGYTLMHTATCLL